ncbi:MAG: UDP-N-acetylmuramoyl-L-alanine--D-glutamate ligase [Phycisphaerales bacterium]|jgi:UDP-N-acetylmuramoylalanine--D-glutamate ligase
MPSLEGKRVTVMGLGRFGGGLGVAKWLHAQGASVLVTDMADAEALAEQVAQLPEGVRTCLGGHDQRDFTSADLVVASPAVARPWANPYLNAATSAGVPITTEIGLVIDRLPERTRVIGVTGTAGKSTTSAMIARALEATGRRVHLGGNIGGSLLEANIQPTDFIVLELSSFMLHWLGQRGWSPGTAVLTNLSPNHLDWHETFEHYEAAKRAIAEQQRPGDLLLCDRWPELATATRVRPIDDLPSLALPGSHNRTNAAMALAAATATLDRHGIDYDRAGLADAIATFPGLPHRLQLVASHAGVSFYNDSKCTTPEATALAVDALADRTPRERIHLVAGGADKGVDLAPIADLTRTLGSLHTIGATGPSIRDRAAGGRVTHDGTLERAFEAAVGRCEPGHAVLLSPGCASWDQFTNYEARGAAFVDLVHRWIAADAQRVQPTQAD